MKRAEKTFFVQNLTEELKAATAVILVDHTGLSVKMQQELKKRLKSVKTSMFVAKNTLFKLAGKNAKVPEEAIADTALSGPTAYILTERDPIAPIQVLYKFSKEFEVPHFKVGIIEGLFQDKQSLEKLAKLPGKDELYRHTLGAIGAPIYGLVNTLEANLQILISILNQKVKSKG